MRIQCTTFHEYRWRTWLPSLLLVLLLVACGGDDDSGPGPVVDTPASLTSDGWARFTAGEFASALARFDAAIGLDADYAAAFVGKGWTQLNLASSPAAMTGAVTSFTEALDLGSTGADVLAGRAAAHLGSGTANGFTQAIADAQAARTADASFLFSHRPSFDTNDLYLIEAFALTGQADFDGALGVANQVAASGIDAGNPSTWVVGGTVHTSYLGAVLGFLHQMSDAYAG